VQGADRGGIRRRTRLALATVVLALVPGGWTPGDVSSSTVDLSPLPDIITYAQHIAPIISRECVSCHNPEGSAPLNLTSFEEVRRRADRIADAAATRLMPPWLPRSEPGTYAGERLLSDNEIELLNRWAAEGTEPGDLSRIGEGRESRDDSNEVWDPGTPDLVVTLPTYPVPADGRDIYRNLVVSIPVTETRWVEYVDLKPGSRSVVHHARMMVDVTSSSRDLAGGDGAPGFDGMDVRSFASNPDGHFIGWTPGKTKLPPLEGMAWRLDPGTDLVVQLHFRTSGQAEEVSAQVEFHFADEPPTRHPAVVVVSSLMIDIPAGSTDYTVTNSFTLPVDVEVLSVYPHAHYLGKTLRATAILPNGREETLINIPDWDFNWQDDYRFAEPIELPAGTTILKEFSFDNSVANPNNPSSPPRRVVYGSNSEDEMADLILQVLPRNEADRQELLQAQAWQHESEDMAYMAHSEFVKGGDAWEVGELDVATRHYQEALQYRADHIGALVGLSRIFAERGDGQSALLIARQGILMSKSQDASAMDALSAAHAILGEVSDALAAAEEAVRLARLSGDDDVAQAAEARIQRLRGG